MMVALLPQLMSFSASVWKKKAPILRENQSSKYSLIEGIVGRTLHKKTLWLLEDFNQAVEMKQREREESGDDFELRTRHQTNAMQQLP